MDGAKGRQQRNREDNTGSKTARASGSPHIRLDAIYPARVEPHFPTTGGGEAMSGNGYSYGDHEPTENCPYCKTVCRADFVDIGVGMQQCGPFHCNACGASEIGPYDAERELTADEHRTGWYAPRCRKQRERHRRANIVSHVQSREPLTSRSSPAVCFGTTRGYVDDLVEPSAHRRRRWYSGEASGVALRHSAQFF